MSDDIVGQSSLCVYELRLSHDGPSTSSWCHLGGSCTQIFVCNSLRIEGKTRTCVMYVISHCAHYLATMLICLVSGGSHIRNSLWRHTLQGNKQLHAPNIVSMYKMCRGSRHCYDTCTFHPFTYATSIRVSATDSRNEAAYNTTCTVFTTAVDAVKSRAVRSLMWYEHSHFSNCLHCSPTIVSPIFYTHL